MEETVCLSPLTSLSPLLPVQPLLLEFAACRLEAFSHPPDLSVIFHRQALQRFILKETGEGKPTLDQATCSQGSSVFISRIN